jgi:hypothetical protein
MPTVTPGLTRGAINQPTKGGWGQRMRHATIRGLGISVYGKRCLSFSEKVIGN